MQEKAHIMLGCLHINKEKPNRTIMISQRYEQLMCQSGSIERQIGLKMALNVQQEIPLRGNEEGAGRGWEDCETLMQVLP